MYSLNLIHPGWRKMQTDASRANVWPRSYFSFSIASRLRTTRICIVTEEHEIPAAELFAYQVTESS